MELKNNFNYFNEENFKDFQENISRTSTSYKEQVKPKRKKITSFLSEIRGVRIISNKYQELCIKFKTMKDNFKEL